MLPGARIVRRIRAGGVIARWRDRGRWVGLLPARYRGTRAPGAWSWSDTATRDRRKRGVVLHPGDAEVEYLGQQTAHILDHHHVRWLQVAMYDPALVRGLDHLRDALEERHELLKRHRPFFANHSSSETSSTSSIAIQGRPSSSTPKS